MSLVKLTLNLKQRLDLQGIGELEELEYGSEKHHHTRNRIYKRRLEPCLEASYITDHSSGSAVKYLEFQSW